MSERLLFIGASGAAGLGARRPKYSLQVAEQLGSPPVLDLSKSGRLIDEFWDLKDEIAAFRPTMAITEIGGAESIVFPGPAVNRLIERYAPASWHGVSGLAPRAYYSSDPRKRRRQRATTAAKILVKQTVIPLSNGRSRMSPEEFAGHAHRLLGWLESIDCHIVLPSLWAWDPRLFPRSWSTVGAPIDAGLRAYAAANPTAVTFVDIAAHLRYWDDFLDDHMHLNDEGHEHMGALLTEAIRSWQRERRPATATLS